MRSRSRRHKTLITVEWTKLDQAGRHCGSYSSLVLSLSVLQGRSRTFFRPPDVVSVGLRFTPVRSSYFRQLPPELTDRTQPKLATCPEASQI